MLLAIINDILDCSKIESGNMELESTAFGLHDVVHDVADILSDVANQNGNMLTVELADSVPRWVEGDPGRLRQSLLNLVANACKFTKLGTIEVQLEGTPRDDHTQVEFAVVDSGIGISPDVQDKIFEPFRQADERTARKFGGTGLGLTITQRLVELMGGKLELESDPGQGSSFHFTLPFGFAKRLDESTGQPQRVTEINARVLIAEDHPINQPVTRRLLEKLGCTVDVIENGQQAVDAAKLSGYDAIFMDCQMPVLDGFGASTAIRRLQIEVPIIALTASAMENDRLRCQEAGMIDFVTKPCRVEDLQAALSRVLLDAHADERVPRQVRDPGAA
jgi:CheY-like chemotaxis protein